ncbi:MAG TPA: tRNA (guanosine(46)-N7)-methyltransferase TrmB [Ktedonobacteraceae bacterium]|nr:tRNA (guanosine(46)-N7)-methyltransferase TrmB [Ktedonobacteraceae bacterium]
MPRRTVFRRLAHLSLDQEARERYLVTFSSRCLYHHIQRFPQLSSDELFANQQPLELEIGCGYGEFLCALAQANQARNFLGIDISYTALQQAAYLASTLALKNIKFIAANARLLYPLLAPNSLEAVYLHFPDPNRKRKFHKRQLFTPALLDAMSQGLCPGGRLSVMTDHREYFLEMLELVEQDVRFEKTHAERYLLGFDAPAISRYQRLWERHGLATLRFEVRRRL